MMYGFGDDQNPYTESVDLLEDIVVEFITQMVSKVYIARAKVETLLSVCRTNCNSTDEYFYYYKDMQLIILSHLNYSIWYLQYDDALPTRV